jgi:hypothetical protein
MHTVDVAFVRIDGRDLILVPVHPRFGMKSADAMLVYTERLRKLAHSAGLSGDVVPVWDDGDGGLMAYARPSLLPHIGRLHWNVVLRHVNVRLHVRARAVEVRTPVTAENQVAGALAS